MRIVIDLPHGSADLTPLRQLCALAPRHELILTVAYLTGAALETLRQHLANLPLQVLRYELPGADASPWLRAAIPSLRQHFLATLEPDVVYLPDLFADAENVIAIGPQSATWHTVVREVASSGASDTVQHLVRQNMLQAASLCLGERDDACARLDALTPRQPLAPQQAEATATQRPRLAYVSPLPPQKSGIAAYSADLIPLLNQYYQVEVILDQDQLDAPWISTHIPLRSSTWFRQHGHEFARVLYHFGNSTMHQHMFDLALRFPGVIVLHDFYLGNVLDYLHHTDAMVGGFQNALYRSHGYPAQIDQPVRGKHPTVWHYPCNKPWVDAADGVIVHSQYPRTLARQWYGEGADRYWRTLPLLRQKPAHAPGRAEARAHLQLGEADWVVCSFGLLGPIKHNTLLLEAWLHSSLANDPNCYLVWVGENDGDVYGQNLAQQIAAHPRIRISGFVTDEEYQRWLAAADMAVQLRTKGRGETSAAVLDCLLYGIPTIVNAHGANAELPTDTVLMLDDDLDALALTRALQTLRDDGTLRAQLSAKGQHLMQTRHAGEAVASAYVAAIEGFQQQGAHQAYRQWRQAIGQLSTFANPCREDYLACARAITHNAEPHTPAQCLIDISALVQTDLRTGIQRVVRSILMALAANPPKGYRVEPVFTRSGGAPYHYARSYMTEQLQVPGFTLDDTPADIRRGDLFLGLDLYFDGTSQNRNRMQAMRDQGVQVVYIVYDILPLLRPDVFPSSAVPAFHQWFDTITATGDGLLCISEAVARETHDWLSAHPPARVRPLQLGYFHLGADIDASRPSLGMPDNAAHILALLAAKPSVLMVGTVEPRKAHAQTLSAFELLWQQGRDVNLVIVGKQGWMVDALAKRLRDHPQNGQHLFWLEGISDEMLLAVYQAATVLLAASEGEGFGLPLIEGAQHGLPLIARGLPVFREVAGEHAFYFDGLGADDLARSLAQWFDLHAQGQAPTSRHMPWLNWQQSADQLKHVIVEKGWQLSWQPCVETHTNHTPNK